MLDTAYKWNTAKSSFGFKKSNWGIKALFIKLKSYSAQNLRIEHGIVSVRNVLDSNAFSYFWKWKNVTNVLQAKNVEGRHKKQQERNRKSVPQQFL